MNCTIMMRTRSQSSRKFICNTWQNMMEPYAWTYWCLNTMAASLQTIFSSTYSIRKICFLLQMSLQLVLSSMDIICLEMTLTHWGRDKMTAKFIFLCENHRILNQTLLKCFLKSPINNMPILMLVMTWRLARCQAMIWYRSGVTSFLH